MLFQQWNPEKGWQDSKMSDEEFKFKFPWLRSGYMPVNYRLKPLSEDKNHEACS